jgi:hypothetical protein
MLYRSQFSFFQKERFTVAYWLFYHSGVSALLSEKMGHAFWDACQEQLTLAPRGTERRHFRGSAATKAVQALHSLYPDPEDFVEAMCPSQSTCETFHTVSSRVEKLPQFGPWIAFKVCDMLERVLDRQIDSSGCIDLWFREPLTGAEKAATAFSLPSRDAAIQFLLEKFHSWGAPPDYKRKVNLQEIETILCKWKAHLGGHYEIGKDTYEILHGLRKYSSRSSSAAHLIDCLQEGTLCKRNTLC